MYGGINLSENEKETLLLPPKFAIYEDVSVKGMGLQVRRAGVKMRWTEMEREEDRGENVDERKVVYDTSHYVKGSDHVEWNRLRVTSLKGNRRYIIPDPIKKGSFEAKWRNVEVRCEEVAKTVRKELCGKFRGKRMYNISESQQDGINSLMKRRKEENDSG